MQIKRETASNEAGFSEKIPRRGGVAVGRDLKSAPLFSKEINCSSSAPLSQRQDKNKPEDVSHVHRQKNVYYSI